MGWTQTSAANFVGIGQSTASRIARGLLFPGVRPVPIPGFGGKGCAPRRQGELPF